MAKQNNDIQKAVFTVTGMCCAYQVSRNTVYAEIKAGRLIAKQIGRKKIITRESADAWVNGLPNAFSDSEA